MRTVYDFSVKDRKGKLVSLKEYANEVLLIVNTATRCGFTPQYEELEQLYEKYHQQGFEVLDFPCNQFGYQAPGDYKTIHGLCTANYGITFPQFQKVMVNGKTALPLYTYLKEKEPFKGFDTTTKVGKYLDETFREKGPHYDQSADVKWNFTKFLIDREGHVIDRFEQVKDQIPEDAGVKAALSMKP